MYNDVKNIQIQEDCDTHFSKIRNNSSVDVKQSWKNYSYSRQVYWKSLLILLIQRDLQRQKFAKAEIQPCREMEYGTLLIIPFEAARYAVLSFQNSGSYAFSGWRAS